MKPPAEQQELKVAFRRALESARTDPTKENRAAAVAASLALSEALPPAKTLGFACRAGKLQYALRNERRRK